MDRARSQDGWILAKFSFCVFMDRDEVEVHQNAKREWDQYSAILTELAWSIKDLLLMVCIWRHGGHVGWQEQWSVSPLGTKLYYYANSAKRNCIVLPTNMAAVSSGCKPRIWHSTPSCCFVILLLCLPVFVAKCILETHQHLCFLCFHSRWRFRFPRFLVPSRQRIHNLFTVNENILRKKTSVRPLGLRRNFIGGTKRAIPTEQYRSIFLARVANHSPGFGSFCLLMKLVLVYVSKPLVTQCNEGKLSQPWPW